MLKCVLIQGGMSAEALQLLDEMRHKGLELNVIVYTAAMHACARASDWSKALDLLKSMRSQGIAPNQVSVAHSL